MHAYFLHNMINCWFSLAASILFLFTANALAANSSLRIPLPFDIKTAETFYLSDGVDFGQSNSNATNVNFCFEKVLSLAGLGYWCSIQEDAYGNKYDPGYGSLYAYAYNYSIQTLHPTDVCRATEKQEWEEVPEYCYYGVCPLPYTYDAYCSITYGVADRYVRALSAVEEWDYRSEETESSNSLGMPPMYEHAPLILGLPFSLALLLYVILGIYYSVKKNIFIHLKSKLFKKNGGLLLKQHIANSHGPGAGCTSIFTAEELAVMETNCVKEKILVEEDQMECFINEIITLAHINHPNLGCCLETEAPILVYEFASNGTLFNYIQDWKNGKISMPHLDILIEIASESAEGLAHLHSQSIIHGNVRSSNILLNDYSAKVAGFGPPRLVPSKESHISTLVQRTLGYLDPEYFVTGQLTDKSDVYSFGVVLVEILTGEKPICFIRPEKQRIIISHFLLSMEQQNGLYQILALQLKEENEEQVRAVAELAKQCLKWSSAERPTMKEVASELRKLSDTYLTVHVN